MSSFYRQPRTNAIMKIILICSPTFKVKLVQSDTVPPETSTLAETNTDSPQTLPANPLRGAQSLHHMSYKGNKTPMAEKCCCPKRNSLHFPENSSQRELRKHSPHLLLREPSSTSSHHLPPCSLSSPESLNLFQCTWPLSRSYIILSVLTRVQTLLRVV